MLDFLNSNNKAQPPMFHAITHILLLAIGQR